MRAGFALVLILLMSFGLAIDEAMAKRFGGGRSFGVQRAKSSLFNHQSHYAKKTPLGKPSFNKWRGFLGGALLVGLLASLFMGHGLGSGLLSWLIVGSLAFLMIRLLYRKKRLGFQNVQSTGFVQSFQQEAHSGGTSYQSMGYPAGFETDSFLRSAKVAFMRLQAAYDQANLSEISDFTAPEVTAEIAMQLQERDKAITHKTEIISLDAVLLDISRQANSFMASVHFTGSVKENSQSITHLDEIWHFRKFANTDKWLVAGIQQEVYEPQ